MSVTVTKEEEVTVITIRADRKSVFPPLCQMLKVLCYSPAGCSVYKGLMKPNLTAVLGTIQIMLGLFSIAIGPGRPWVHPMDPTDLGSSYWLGAVYIAVGIVSILGGRFPSVCLVVYTVFMNITGAVFAFAGIIMYSKEIVSFNFILSWNWYDYSPGPRAIYQRFLTNLDAVSVALSVLELCLCIAFAVLGIKALVNRKKKEQAAKDLQIEAEEPPLKENLLTSPCA